MTISQTGSLFHYLCKGLRAWKQDDRTDAELLTAFAQTRDNQAFTTLVARHGQFVWGVCQRILANQQDAEDAFQATFLVLAQRAGQIGFKELVGHWLYGVAQRTSWKLRNSIARRKCHERLKSTMMPAIFSEDEGSDADLLSALDEGVQQLPNYYRVPLILCRLEGRTYAEAARLLGCHRTTVHDRVAHAEALLRERLTRRGVSLGCCSMAAILGQATVATAVPPGLDGSTVLAALAFVRNTFTPIRSVWLAQEVLQSMGSHKALLLWGVTVATLLCLGSVGLGLLAQQEPLTQGQETVAAPAELQAPDAPGEKRLDYYGDLLPEGALARIGTLRFRPDKWGNEADAAFLPDGKTLVSVHSTDIVHFWDLANGKERRRLRIPGIQKVRSVRVSPDGRLLAVGGQSEIQVCDLTTDPPRPRWTHHEEGRIINLAFSSDSKTLACSDDFQRSRTIRLLDAHTGQQRQTLLSEMTWIGALAFSPDGKFLAEGESIGEPRAGTVCLWDLDTRKKRHILTSPKSYFAGFEPERRRMATWDLEGISLWDVATGKENHRFAKKDAFSAFESSAIFLPDGTFLETLREGAGVRLRFWDPDTGKPRRPDLELPGLPGGRPSPDGKLLATVRGNTIQVWNVETGKLLGPESIAGDVLEIAFSPSGDTFATFSIGDYFFSSVQLWQAYTGAPEPRLKFDPPQLTPSLYAPLGLVYSHDHRLYTLRHTLSLNRRIIKDLVVWDTRTGKLVELPLGIQQEVGKFTDRDWAIAPDGRLLALAHEDYIALYELATGKEVRRLQGLPQGKMERLVFSADSQSLAAEIIGEIRQGRRRVYAVWDVATGFLRMNLLPPTDFVTMGPSFALSSDGRWLAVPAVESEVDKPDNRVVQLWEVASGRLGPLLQIDNQEKVRSVALSSDRRTLAAGCEDGMVQLWDLSSGKLRHSFSGHRSLVVALAFSPDGLCLASASCDTTALVWDLRRLQPLAAAAANRPKTEELLDALANADAAATYRAICQLVETPGTAIADLRQRLQPKPAADPRQLQGWLDDLDSKDFKTRERAIAEMAKQSDRIEATLRKALDDRPTLEKRQRLEKLLELIHPSRNPARLIVLRGIEVLERIGTPEAHEVLAGLAQLQGNLVGHEAQAALRRLARQRPDAGRP